MTTLPTTTHVHRTHHHTHATREPVELEAFRYDPHAVRTNTDRTFFIDIIGSVADKPSSVVATTDRAVFLSIDLLIYIAPSESTATNTSVNSTVTNVPFEYRY